MAYNKQNFKSGSKLYASQLNAMDEQIHSNEVALESKQAKGEYITKDNIKTINGQSLIGEGNIEITGGEAVVTKKVCTFKIY